MWTKDLALQVVLCFNLEKLPGKARDRGPTPRDNRLFLLFLEAVLWRVGTGAPWRDLPACLGNWNSQLGCFRRWAANGVLQWLFETLSGDPDLEYLLHDGTTVPVHQKAAGAKGALGASAWAAPGAG
ncbi:MAG: transposase [Synechococcus sp. SB0676_bin_10]|uniref:Transposase n=1 Tax=Synechococcus sp. SB0676_bin_10 TaxID=2604869 RepID=A0A6B1F980_9SYNE|nr:transposase [Synechococcus sp. SB0676_bin_10]